METLEVTEKVKAFHFGACNASEPITWIKRQYGLDIRDALKVLVATAYKGGERRNYALKFQDYVFYCNTMMAGLDAERTWINLLASYYTATGARDPKRHRPKIETIELPVEPA